MKNKGLLFALLLGGALLSLAAGKAAKLVNPVSGKIASRFGNRADPIHPGETHFHNGVDISVPEGTPVKSPWPGKVQKVFFTERGGIQVVILHDNGFKTGYAHFKKALVRTGQTVRAGKIIGLSGKTGQVTGPHLHFTVTNPSGLKVDPEGIFTFS